LRSTARSALGESSAATKPRPRPGLRRSHPGRLDHSRDPAPLRRSLAAAHGGARSAPAARLGSGRSRPAGPRRRIRLEAQAQALGPEFTPHLGVETVDKFACGAAGARLGSQAARSGDFTTLGPVWDHSNGGRAENSSERARISAALPNVCHHLAVRTAPPCM
jgi:hypothetical protein